MRAAAMTGAKMAGGQAHGRTRENIPGPGTGESGRQADGHALLLVNRGRSFDKRGILVGLSRIVSTGDLDLDVTVTALGQMRLEFGFAIGGGLVGHQP